MNRVRLRDAYAPSNLRDIYATPYDTYKWPAHRIRASVTVAFAEAMIKQYWVRKVADLSCGDGSISGDIAKYADHRFGDLSGESWLNWHGPIEETIEKLSYTDLFVCTETIEHLNDPDAVLRRIRPRTRHLLLSTPINAWDDYKNPEHYWAWDREYVESMLGEAGFKACSYIELDLRNMPDGEYCFGIWWTS